MKDITFGEFFAKLREKEGYSQAALGKVSGIANSTIARIESGETKKPDADTLIKLAPFLKISPRELLHIAYLLAGGFRASKLEMIQIGANFQAQEINSILDRLRNSEDTEQELRESMAPYGPTVKIPVLGTIPCGDAALAKQEVLEWVDVPAHEVQDGDYFYLRVQGDSMTGSRIYPGDKVLVRRQPTVDNGQIAVVMVNGEDATLKRVKRLEEAIILYPDNPKYQPQIYKADEVEILGLVRKVEFRP